jgi:uncharacterized protein
VIEGARTGGWQVQGQWLAGTVLIAPQAAWSLGALALADCLPSLAALATLDPPATLLLIGTGATMQRPPPALLAAATAAGMAPEFMDSRAAARTYNVLVNEGRAVAALLG